MKDAMTYAHEAGFFSFNVVGWKAEFERLIEAVRAEYEAPLRLAEQSIVINDPHPPHRLCECTACLEYWTPLPDCDAFAASGKPIDHIPDATKMVAPEGYALISIEALKAWGKYDEVRSACRFPAEPMNRPQNCGTGYCSCIECPYEPVKQEEAGLPVEPVAMYCSYPNCTCINPTLCRGEK